MAAGTDRLRLMCVLAHPDDESLGTGGILAKYAAEGVDTYLVTATRGERGWVGDPAEDPGLDRLGQIREGELLAAAGVLGLQGVDFLDYIDGDLDRADPQEATGRIVGHLRRVRPHVVVTFGPDGAYGHPDHIAICQYTTAALVCAADASYADPQGLASWRVPKLYYMADRRELLDSYQSIFGDLVMHVDGVGRRGVAWDDWAITAWIDAADYWRTVLQAIACHRSQVPNYQVLAALPEEVHRTIWGAQTYYRAVSLVNGGRAVETDLFAGLR